MYQTSEYFEPKEGLEMFDPHQVGVEKSWMLRLIFFAHQGQYVEQVALQYESEPQYVEQYVVATNDNEAKVIMQSKASFDEEEKTVFMSESSHLQNYENLPNL